MVLPNPLLGTELSQCSSIVSFFGFLLTSPFGTDSFIAVSFCSNGFSACSFSRRFPMFILFLAESKIYRNSTVWTSGHVTYMYCFYDLTCFVPGRASSWMSFQKFCSILSPHLMQSISPKTLQWKLKTNPLLNAFKREKTVYRTEN